MSSPFVDLLHLAVAAVTIGGAAICQAVAIWRLAHLDIEGTIRAMAYSGVLLLAAHLLVEHVRAHNEEALR